MAMHTNPILRLQFMYKSQQSPAKKTSNSPYPLKSGQKSTSGSISNYREIMIETNDKQMPFISIYKLHIRNQHKALHMIASIVAISCKVKMFYGFNRLKGLRYGEDHLKSKVMFLGQTMKKIAKRQSIQLFLRLCLRKTKNSLTVVALNIVIHLTANKKRGNMKMAFQKLAFNSYLKEEKIGEQIIEEFRKLQVMASPQKYIQNLRKSNIQALLNAEQKKLSGLRARMRYKRNIVSDSQIFLAVLCNIIKAYESEKTRYQQKIQQGDFNKDQGQEDQAGNIKESIKMWVEEMKTMNKSMKKAPKRSNGPHRLITIFTENSKNLQANKQKYDGIMTEMIDSQIQLNTLAINSLSLFLNENQCINKQFAELVAISNEENKLVNFIGKVGQNSQIRTLAETILQFHKKITEIQTEIQSQESLPQQSVPFKLEESEQSLTTRFFKALRMSFSNNNIFGQQVSKEILMCEYKFKEKDDKYADMQQRLQNITRQLANEQAKNKSITEDYLTLQERYRFISDKQEESETAQKTITNRQLCQKLNSICIMSAKQFKESCSQGMMRHTDMMKQLLGLKMQSQDHFMAYEKEISMLKRGLIQAHNTIDQLQVRISQKDNQIRKHETTIKQGNEVPSNIRKQPQVMDLLKQNQALLGNLVRKNQQRLARERQEDKDERIRRLEEKVRLLNRKIYNWEKDLSGIESEFTEEAGTVKRRNLQSTEEKSLAQSKLMQSQDSKVSLSYSVDQQQNRG